MLLILVGSNWLWCLGWHSLYLPSSAMALALVGSGLALPANIALSGLSPAHVFASDRISLEVSFMRGFAGLSGHTIVWHGARRGKPRQLMFRALTADKLELRSNKPTARPLATFGARLLAATYTGGWRLGRGQLAIDATVAYQRIHVYAARGVWLSGGWQSQPFAWLRLGLAVKNIGAGEPLNVDTDRSLARYGVGLAIRLGKPRGRFSLAGSHLSLDAWYDTQRGLIPSLAWQSTGDVLQFMLGLRAVKGAALGAGGFRFSHRRWSVTYAYAYQEASLGQPRLLTITRQI